MKQFYATIYEMECVKNGMYSSFINESKVKKSIELLSNLSLFENEINNVFSNWKISTCVNLSNKSINRKAWLGQSACLIHHSANEKETKKAWFELTEQQQIKANKIAEIKIKEFEKVWNGKLESILKLGSKDATLMEYQMKLNLEWRN
jgi:hypothetical protein